MKRDLGRSVPLGFGLVCVVLLLSAALSFRNTRQLHEHDLEVARTHELLNATEAVLSSLKDAETGQRGYLLTDNEDYLQPYLGAPEPRLGAD